MSSLFPIANNFSKGISLTKLSDGSEFKEILLPSLGGTNNAAKIELPKTAIVTKADFNVTGLPDASGKWPRDVSIDVGNDGD